MITFDELHVVTAIVGGQDYRLATANLCGDIDTLAGVRARVVANMASVAPLIASADAGRAFDEAFDECETKPGNGATATATIGDCDIVVTRSLEGAA